LIGQTILHYRIESKLGSGGMGEVYLAEDTLLRRKVALKLLPPNFQQDSSARKRFLHEARSAAGLAHANICTIHEVGEFDGKDFIVMEYVDGQTLRDRLAQSALPLPEARQIAVEITEALEEAHENGIVHRDLKPANIMLTRKGHAKVMDFGLAKQMFRPDQAGGSEETISVVTMERSPVGTLAYMSPEQLRGEAVEIRSDIFSLGVVFYEMLGGLHPFRTSSFLSTSDRILHEEPLPIRRLNPSIPERIEKLLKRMLSKDPAGRPASAREVRAEFQTALNPEAGHSPAWNGIGHMLKRRWKTATAAGAILLILLFAAIPSVRRIIRRNVLGTNIPSRIHVAVLPLESLNVTPENSALVLGLTETLNARLTRVTERHAMQVVPSSEIREKRVQTVEQARREFGVNLVIRGSLQQAGDMVRVTIALIDVAARRQLHADTITAAASDPFALEDRVIASVLDSMEVELQPQEKSMLQLHRTREPAAHDFYLRARGYLQDYQKPESIDNAIDVLRRALELDRKYALAYAGLGEAFWQRFRQTQETKWIGETLTACEQAVSLDNRLSSGYACLGTVYNGRGKYEQAVEEFQHAVTLDPTSDDAFRGLGMAYESMGDFAAAEKTYRRAIELRPQYWAGYSWAGGFYARRGRYGEAAERFTQVTRLAPDSFVGFSNLGGILVYEGRYADAIPILERSVALRPTGPAYSNLGTAYFYQRKFIDSARAFDEATRLYEHEQQWMIWGNLADAYYWAPGKRHQAGEAYSKAISLGEQRLHVNPRNAPLLGYMAYYHAMKNDRTKSQDCARRGLAAAPRDPELLYNLALAYHQLGDMDQTLGWLGKALEAGYSRATVRDTPILDDMRSNLEFQRLLQEY
jgi:serine/threonine protein kinase/tetratricopeptide (TPR) repeat protein